jgi:hypothetical protein
MSDTFADAMRVVAKDALGLRDNFFGERSDPVVDAILAMPEMQAIMAWMVWAFDATVDANGDVAQQEPSLPDSVIDWITP